MNDPLPQIYLVRHGETAWTLGGQATGRTGIALTDEGERNARELGSRLKGVNFAQVLTSPLQRARRTAELAGFGKDTDIDADLTEWDYGVYEGRRTADIRAGRPGWRLLENGCPGGETLEAVSARAENVIERRGSPRFQSHDGFSQYSRLSPRSRRAGHPPVERCGTLMIQRRYAFAMTPLTSCRTRP